MAAVLSLIEVVCPHDRPCPAFLHRSLEAREINFTQGPVVHCHIDCMAVSFLVVESKMLDTGSHTVLLKIPDIRDNHLRCQVRIFAHVLEIPAVKRSPVNVNTRSENHILLPVPCLFSEGFAVKGGHFRIPGGSQTGQCRESRT